MKIKLILLLCLFSFSVLGQTIPESKVPETVVKNFKRKHSQAQDLSWEKKEYNYIVFYSIKEKQGEAEYNKDGVLIMEKNNVDPYDLMPSIQDYIKDNYRGYKYEYAELIQKGREKYFSVFIYPKKSKDEPILTQVRFAATGKFIEALDEDGNKIEDESDEDETKTETVNNKKNESPKEIDIIPESKVTEIVVTTFHRRHSKATNVYWQKKSFDFLVKYKIDGLDGQALYDRDGTLLSQREDKSTENIHPVIQRYLDENYGSYIVKKVEFIQEGRKDKFYSVFIYDKKSKEDNPPITEVQFTEGGRYLTVYEPDLEYEEGEDIWADEDFAELADEESENLKDVKEQEISKKELPSVALDYLNENFDKDWNWKKIMIVNHKKYGNAYYVLMKREGQKLSVEHYFDINGELLERNEL
ncbi:MAG: hypothetical protein K9J13_04855 [Saprospiraceae bacterium]|nr:hypothetical protein [Saprospiraceae bacterium]